MGHHVLVRTDNTTTVAYINCQGGLRSGQLHMHARKLILWSCGRLLSLRATHVPGGLNTGADLLSRGAPVYREWTQHPEIVQQMWARYGQVAVDLFTTRENRQCALFYSAQHGCSPRRRRTSARLAARASLRVPSPCLDTPNSVQSERTQPHTDFDSSALARYALAGGDISAPVLSALAAPAVAGPAITGGRNAFPSAPRTHGIVGLGPEWLNLSAVGLSQRVISNLTKCSSLLH